MEYRRIGASDLVVSEIALGSWLTISGGVVRERAVACIHKALDNGINFFDTANVYGQGSAELILGEVLSGLPRDGYVLGTKAFYPMNQVDRGLSRAQIHKQIEASLRRLRADYVDLYQCHRYDYMTPLEETLQALTEIVQQGKARYIGFSEWPVSKVAAALAVHGVTKFVSSQPQYSLLWRRPERKLIPLCREHSISQIVWSPLAQGLLTGKYLPNLAPPSDSRAASASMGQSFPIDRLSVGVLEPLQRLSGLAKEAGLTLAQLSLAWVLREQNVAAAITGATRPEQVEENAAGSGRRLDPELLRRIEAIVAPALRPYGLAYFKTRVTRRLRMIVGSALSATRRV